jgi:hypothetical protein
MPLNISKATATEYAFVLGNIPGNTGIHAADILKLNLFSVSLPGVSLTNAEMYWEGNHVQFHLGNISFEPLNINFIIDSAFENWKCLFNWITFIANNKDKPSSAANDYVTDANIVIYDNFGQSHSFITFKNLWIQSLGEVTFSIRDGESHIECNASFLYDRYEVVDS